MTPGFLVSVVLVSLFCLYRWQTAWVSFLCSDLYLSHDLGFSFSRLRRSWNCSMLSRATVPSC